MPHPSIPGSSRNLPLLVASAAAVLGLVIFAVFLRWDGLAFSVSVTDFASLLAPVVFAAAVVVRVVEILISPWRDTGANKLEKRIVAIKARSADTTSDIQKANDLREASEELDEYRGKTQRYAFAVSLTVSTIVSIAGVRALGPFLNTAKFKELRNAHPDRAVFFLCVDVALTAALLAGGADGMHSVVNAVTSFFNASPERTAS